MSVDIVISIMKKSKEGAFKKWELLLMTIIIASGVILDYGNVDIVIKLSEQQQEKISILKNFMVRELHAIDYVELKDK